MSSYWTMNPTVVLLAVYQSIHYQQPSPKCTAPAEMYTPGHDTNIKECSIRGYINVHKTYEDSTVLIITRDHHSHHCFFRHFPNQHFQTIQKYR